MVDQNFLDLRRVVVANDEDLLVVFARVEELNVHGLPFHQGVVDLVEVEAEELCLDAFLKLRELLHQNHPILLSNSISFHFGTGSVQEEETPLESKLVTPNAGRNPELATPHLLIVDLVAYVVLALQHEHDFIGLVQLVDNDLSGHEVAHFHRLHHLDHELTVALVIVIKEGNVEPEQSSSSEALRLDRAGPGTFIGGVVEVNRVFILEDLGLVLVEVGVPVIVTGAANDLSEERVVEGLLLESEEPAELPEELLEQELGEDGRLGGVGQLVEQVHVLFRQQEVVLVALPFLAQELGDAVLQVQVDHLARVELSKQQEELLKVFIFIEVLVEVLDCGNHVEELAHDVREHRHAKEQDEGTAQPL
mmetsp:Transcript_13415/g.20978  ORF Transcript_13415/g.20978 Transcript_13415/m.20978 type:complete len:364 (-) Transcript_13415:207-1298(-)